jgi:alpha-amylase
MKTLISIVQNIGDAYHGYWAKDFYKINEHFGSADDLKQLVNVCHSKNVCCKYLYISVF